MTTPNFPKTAQFKFTGATTGDPVTVMNTSTGERITRDVKTGSIMRLEGKNKSVVVALDNFVQGWTVGDVLVASVGGTKAGTSAITLTASTEATQTATATATAVNTSTLTI